MRGPNPGIEQPDLRIAWAEPDGLLLAGDQLLDRAGHKLAPTKMRIRMRPVAIERDHHFVFGVGVGVSVLSAELLGFREMRDGAARQRRQGPLGQFLRARYIGWCGGRHEIEDPGGQRDRQPTLSRRGLRIEHPGSLEQRYRRRTVFPRWRLQPHGTATQNVIARVGMLDWPRSLRLDQFTIER